MAARAIWKGRIRLQGLSVPVKLYSAIEDKSIRFRLLHRADSEPVKQAMVHPETSRTIAFDQIWKSWLSADGDRVLLSKDELESIQPEGSRDIEMLEFHPPGKIDHRWYDRPYFLGPDDAASDYAALVSALESSALHGLARWVMRNREYHGVLMLYQDHPILITLRHADELVSVAELDAPKGNPLDAKELDMAAQLVEMLADDFDPHAYEDDYRNRVMDLVESKIKGRKTSTATRPRKKKTTADLTAALKASLKGAKPHGKEKRTGAQA